MCPDWQDTTATSIEGKLDLRSDGVIGTAYVNRRDIHPAWI